MNRNILFLIPDERKVYENIGVKVGAFHLPSLAFAVLGAIARQGGYEPVVLDLTLCTDDNAAVRERLAALQPVFTGVTCTSATYGQAVGLARTVKAVCPSTRMLIGGPHASATVEETLAKGCFDHVFIGEAEVAFARLLAGDDPAAIPGVAGRTATGVMYRGPAPPFLRNLDDFPMPDYGLYDLSRYPVSRLQARHNPVVWLETSRGCPFDCQICNKVVHGQTFRPKSAARVLAELEQLVAAGVREVHIADDGFTTDLARAEGICDALIARRLPLVWSCVNGIRVDRVSRTLLTKMRRAGCYRISFGIESGNQAVLDGLGKRITLEQVRDAVALAKAAGLEVFGFFMFGFRDDTPGSMADTIAFAKSLRLDLAKASIVVPFPGSPLHEDYRRRGLLAEVDDDYRHYNVYGSMRRVYRHPTLDWETIERHQQRFAREVYLNPGYVARRLMYALRNGTLGSDLAAALSVKWFGK